MLPLQKAPDKVSPKPPTEVNDIELYSLSQAIKYELTKGNSSQGTDLATLKKIVALAKASRASCAQIIVRVSPEHFFLLERTQERLRREGVKLGKYAEQETASKEMKGVVQVRQQKLVWHKQTPKIRDEERRNVRLIAEELEFLTNFCKMLLSLGVIGKALDRLPPEYSWVQEYRLRWQASCTKKENDCTKFAQREVTEKAGASDKVMKVIVNLETQVSQQWKTLAQLSELKTALTQSLISKVSALLKDLLKQELTGKQWLQALRNFEVASKMSTAATPETTCEERMKEVDATAQPNLESLIACYMKSLSVLAELEVGFDADGQPLPASLKSGEIKSLGTVVLSHRQRRVYRNAFFARMGTH